MIESFLLTAIFLACAFWIYSHFSKAFKPASPCSGSCCSGCPVKNGFPSSGKPSLRGYRACLLPLVFFITVYGAPSEIQLKSESVIREFFGPGPAILFMKYHIPPQIKSIVQNQAKQKFYKDDVYIWKVAAGSTLAGFALLDNVPGKAMPITFLVIFDKEGRILHTEIVKYRESVGGEVSNRNWNKQFEGKTSDSGFAVGQDIDGITGATLSVVSITRGINKLACLLKEIKDTL